MYTKPIARSASPKGTAIDSEIAEEARRNEEQRPRVAQERLPVEPGSAPPEAAGSKDEHRAGVGEKAAHQPTPQRRGNVQAQRPIDPGET